jgi:polar amino acid transport system substrate-binding protein
VPNLRPLLILALCCPSMALAVTLHVCTDVRNHPPLLMADGSGSVGVMVVAAAREAGLEIAFHAMPIARCRAGFNENTIQSYPLTPFSPELVGQGQYPEHHGKLDRSRSTAGGRLMVYRRIGEKVDWDGSRFSGLVKPVLIPAGSVVIRDRVREAGAPIDSNGSSFATNFEKLLAGRGDVAIGFEHEGTLLLERPSFSGKIEVLPVPLSDELFYMIVHKDFYHAHQVQVEAMWDAIGRMRAAELSGEAAKALKK